MPGPPDRPSELTRNAAFDPHEDPRTVAQAVRAGWRIDMDCWWTRPLGVIDAEIPADATHFGFTANGEVFVRRAYFALMYDAGEIAPKPELAP